MVIFSMVFGSLAKLPSDGIPYPVFSYVALLPWQLFAGALQRGDLDREYIQRWSIRMDFFILMKTLKVVMLHKGVS
jgi:ABC-type polysaccharide/polyol phosphate export permease